MEKFFSKRKLLFFTIAFIVFTSLLISRRVDSVTKPQFWAEDGVFWYTEAYNATNQLQPFFVPKQGYFQTVSRLGGFFSQFFGIAHAPLVFNLLALLVQVLPPLFFLSKRFEYLVQKKKWRFFLGLLYIGLLGTAETHLNLTNAQWRLAILMYLIIIAGNSKKILWNVFDVAFLVLAGLSGPFVFFAFPLASIYAYFSRKFKNMKLCLGILLLTFLIQCYSFLFIVSDATRSKEELGANVITFFKILAGNVFVGGILGINYFRKIAHLGLWKNGFLPAVISLLCSGLLAYVFLKANWEMKLLLAFCFAVLFAGMLTPMVSLVKPQWSVMAGGSGGRYYLLPKLAWIISLVWFFAYTQNGKLKKVVGILFLLYFLLGIPSGWIFAKYKDYNFPLQVNKFEQLKSGENFTFKINPKWDMALTKK